MDDDVYLHERSMNVEMQENERSVKYINRYVCLGVPHCLYAGSSGFVSG